MADALPFRVCDLCGGVDDHPRHVITGVIPDVYPPDPALAELVVANIDRLLQAGSIDTATALRISRDYDDTTSQDRHIDCCAQAGCPKAGTADACGPRAEKAAGKTGAAMRKAALSLRRV